jgi:hypothetical protein
MLGVAHHVPLQSAARLCLPNMPVSPGVSAWTVEMGFGRTSWYHSTDYDLLLTGCAQYTGAGVCSKVSLEQKRQGAEASAALFPSLAPAGAEYVAAVRRGSPAARVEYCEQVRRAKHGHAGERTARNSCFFVGIHVAKQAEVRRHSAARSANCVALAVVDGAETDADAQTAAQTAATSGPVAAKGAA